MPLKPANSACAQAPVGVIASAPHALAATLPQRHDGLLMLTPQLVWSTHANVARHALNAVPEYWSHDMFSRQPIACAHATQLDPWVISSATVGELLVSAIFSASGLPSGGASGDLAASFPSIDGAASPLLVDGVHPGNSDTATHAICTSMRVIKRFLLRAIGTMVLVMPRTHRRDKSARYESAEPVRCDGRVEFTAVSEIFPHGIVSAFQRVTRRRSRCASEE